MFRKCLNTGCVIHVLAVLSNLILMAVIFIISLEAHGTEQYMVLLFWIPPILSIIAMRRHDKEERALKKRIRKAHLRKELAELSEYDESK
jgi:hypothetical protein